MKTLSETAGSLSVAARTRPLRRWIAPSSSLSEEQPLGAVSSKRTGKEPSDARAPDSGASAASANSHATG
jgi:hypothetical protein